ncbi:protein FAM221B [Patella vulgata]|uniref:protein FAM221B n=1 Tax=Patella vulgata TaxID=6465 RepID=UPI0021809233|nr:protein FAM221B [Patella vulgata]XP_050402133.1 protein FAM221B [Patella vulgata]
MSKNPNPSGARPKQGTGGKSSASKPGAVGSSSKSTTAATSKPKTTNKAVVARGNKAMAPLVGGNQIKMKEIDGILHPEGYTMRKIEPAKNYDVVSFARAMNDDFAPRLKKLFDIETEAAIEAQRTGIYIGWRCPEFKHDCQRLTRHSKCFCGHLLAEHNKYTGRSVRVPCQQCSCKAYAWIPARPEEIGEFWHQRRRDFEPALWRAKCKCKHHHEQHDPNTSHRCKVSGCSCGRFFSDFLCAACDRHWEVHETFFETEDIRAENGLPIGEHYLPFNEMPNLRNITLTGDEEDDSMYRALTGGQGSIPRNQRAIGNDAPVNFGGGSSGKSGFRPTYD